MAIIPYKHISILIMPTDYCNMNCVYCFNGKRTCREKIVMTEKVLEHIFHITLPFYSEVKIIWHGGEPLSVGKNFYEKVVELEKKENVNDAVVYNSIQTNLTLLDEEYAEFFLKNGFHIGSSYDGITNEKTRHNSERILSGHEILKKCGGNNGFICVVQKNNIDHLIEDYEWFKKKKINYNLNHYLADPTKPNELLVPVEHYVQRMCEFFDYWLMDTGCNISVSYFENYLKYILKGYKNLCCFNSCMGKHIGIHYDGTIYGCNREFPEKYSFGNVLDYEDIHECFESRGFHELLQSAVKRRNLCKEKCEIFNFCAGGCNSVALVSGNLEAENRYVCNIRRQIYKYIEEKVILVKLIQENELKKQINPYMLKYLAREN